MAHGRVLLTGPSEGPDLGAWQGWVTGAGYWSQNPALGRDAVYGMAASALPIVAAVDLWPILDQEHIAYLEAIDAQMPLGSPLLALCDTVHVDELATHLKRRTRLIGFSTLVTGSGVGLFELLPSSDATDEAIRRAAMFVGSLGFHTETLPRGSWAVLPRLLAAVVNESAFLIGEGSTRAEDIDRAMRTAGPFARGPLSLADDIGLDRIVSVLEGLQQEFEHERYRTAPYLRQLVRLGATGRAAGRGFHQYAIAEASEDRI